MTVKKAAVQKATVEKARELGFCFGVRRAIQVVEEAAGRLGALNTLGPVVHNQRVVDKLEALGVKAVGEAGEASGVVALPSHGAPPQVVAGLKQRGVEVVDATCPMVRRAQKAAHELAAAGFKVVIFGDAQHPEVRGVLGWAGEEATATLDAASVSFRRWPKKLGILSQSTQNAESFATFVSQLLARALEKATEVRVVNTICHATRERQQAALELARRSDLMLVVGSFASANTRQLARLCSQVAETHQVEDPQDIELSWLEGKNRVGVTAGASTPDEAVAEVVARLEELCGAAGGDASGRR